MKVLRWIDMLSTGGPGLNFSTVFRSSKRLVVDGAIGSLREPVHDAGSLQAVTLAFHAEKLHDQHVWKKVKRVAEWMTQQNIKATFFVYPLRAAVAGKSIAERVQRLGALGHEIAQHTHFYAGVKIAEHEKLDDLSETNVVHCLRRDFETLMNFGFSPKGFSAGSWYINDAILDELVALGFVYDCSAQFPRPNASPAGPNYRCLRRPRYYSKSNGRLLCLPTTCSLGEWFKWGGRMRRESDQCYQIVYLHDYDLLSPKLDVLLFCFLRLIKWKVLGESVSVAEYCVASGGSNS